LGWDKKATLALVDAEIERDPITQQIIGGAIDVHRALGPGLLESVYEQCMAVELSQRGLTVQRQVAVPIMYKGVRVDAGYKIDMVINDTVVVELKAVETVLPVHEAQLLSYMRLLGVRVGLLLNFHVPLMKNGIFRRVI